MLNNEALEKSGALFVPPVVSPILNESRAFGNVSKDESRVKIAQCINALYDRKIVMVEFLGAGVGADYYAKEVKNLLGLILVESKKKTYYEWMQTTYERFSDKYNHLYLFPEFGKLHKVLGELEIAKYDVFNLDFCTYCFDNGKSNSPLYLIEHIFKNDLLARDGVIFASFQVDGLGIRMAKVNGITHYQHEDEIFSVISGLAEKHNRKLKSVLFNKYKSGRGTTMLNLGLQSWK